MRLFGLAETLGEDGWLKVLRLEDYAPRSLRQPEMLQQVLFTYTDAIWQPLSGVFSFIVVTATRRRVYESVCPHVGFRLSNLLSGPYRHTYDTG
jgi:hypothetical protein